MKSWCSLILLCLFLLSLAGQGNAFFPLRSITVEIEHSHSHGDKDHSHHADVNTAHQHDHASKENGKDSDESHCHKICVTAYSPILVSNQGISLIALEARELLSSSLNSYFPSAKLGSIFRPPIFV
jgi:hypothetical protein